MLNAINIYSVLVLNTQRNLFVRASMHSLQRMNQSFTLVFENVQTFLQICTDYPTLLRIVTIEAFYEWEEKNSVYFTQLTRRATTIAFSLTNRLFPLRVLYTHNSTLSRHGRTTQYSQ